LQPSRAERHLYLLGEVDSTNARLRTLARLGAADGTVLIAEVQWGGRGWRRQPWFSPMGGKLYASGRILGVGGNLNVDTDTLAAPLGEAGELATSLSAVLGHAVDRNLFAANWHNRIDAWERTWERGGASEIRRAWAERDVLIGRTINVRGVGFAFEARAMGIDAAGALVVEDTPGPRRPLG